MGLHAAMSAKLSAPAAALPSCLCSQPPRKNGSKPESRLWPHTHATPQCSSLRLQPGFPVLLPALRFPAAGVSLQTLQPFLTSGPSYLLSSRPSQGWDRSRHLPL